MKLVVLDSTAISGISSGPGSPAYFSRFAIEHLRQQGHDITILDSFDRDACAEADAVWTEWCNEDAFEAAASGVCRKLIVRVRGFDVWNPVERLQRENVDAFVCESPFVQDLLVKEHPAVTWKTAPLVLASGIDVCTVPFRERKHGPVVALAARAIADKGYQLAFEWARQRPDVDLHVACALGDTLQATRLMRYLRHTKPINVTIHSAVDTVKWLDEIDANYLLSASVWETLGYTIVEALALGIKPLIHDTPGAALNWGSEPLWRSFGELDALVEESVRTPVYNSHAYRWFVEDHFDAAKLSPRFAELVLAPPTREAPVRPTAQPVFNAVLSDTFPIPTAPMRLDFPSPLRGGPLLVRIRDHLSPHGRVRFSGTRARTFVDFTPGPPEPRVLALDTIVRSDAAGLERMLLSVLPYVDEIVLGVDERSDAETVAVARAFADRVHTFDAAAIGLDEAAWAAGKIDFAAARNLGRAMVQSPWTLVVDSDEYIGEADELRPLLQAGSHRAAFSPRVCIEVEGKTKFEQRDFQRLARTEYRWHQAAHNQLAVPPGAVPPCDVHFQIVSDTSLRTAEERARRDGQRELGIEDLIAEAMAGNLNALFHVAKHKAVQGTLAEGAAIVEKFRLSIEPNGPGAYQRQWVALAMAIRYYQEDNSPEANRWACRALLDGPSLNAFCLLGDLAEEDGDLPRARAWYEAACAMTIDGPIGWPEHANRRTGRLAGIRRAIAGGAAPRVD